MHYYYGIIIEIITALQFTYIGDGQIRRDPIASVLSNPAEESFSQ